MASINLNAIAENATRLGSRLQETISEHTRELSIGRSTTSYFDIPEERVKNIRDQLDSSSDKEKLDAMKKLIALISKGRNVSEFFAQVVKNVASHNLEIRKLVYIYILRYAEQEPDLALLSINTFQKDLSDSNPLIRSMALRVLSGIRVPMIGSIVILAIKKCAADLSPYVRKAAALAIPKCFGLDESHQPELIKLISNMLRERSPLAVGSVVVAFETVCPTRLDLIHQHYRRLCRTLIDMDEWGQADLLNLLTRYARTMLPRSFVTAAPSQDGKPEPTEEVDQDLKLLLTSAEPLYCSRNPAVVLAVARAFFYLAPPSEMKKLVPPLVGLLHSSPEVERVVLAYLVIISHTLASLLAPHHAVFFVRSHDMRPIKKDKLRLLRALISKDNYATLLREFIHYADDPDDEFVGDAIKSIGWCARVIPESTQQCLNALMGFVRSPYDTVVASAVLVLKSLVQTRIHKQGVLPAPQSLSPLTIISHLAYRIDDIHHPKARACVIWLVGQYAAAANNSGTTVENGGLPGRVAGIEGIADWAPDVLRKAAASFSKEDASVKLQTITLSAKLFVLNPTNHTLTLLTRYVLALAQYDLNFDVRDRARTIGSLLAGVSTGLSSALQQDGIGQGEQEGEGDGIEARGGVVLRREQVKMVLFEGKQEVSDDTESHDPQAMLGSLRSVISQHVPNPTYLPDWLEQGIDPSLRDTEEDHPPPPLANVTSIQSSQVGGIQMPRSVVASSRNSPVVLTPNVPSPAGSVGAGKEGGGKGAWVDLDKFYEEESEESESEDEEEDDEKDGEDEDEEEEGDEKREEHARAEGVEEEAEESEEGDEEEEEEEEGQGEMSRLLNEGEVVESDIPRVPSFGFDEVAEPWGQGGSSSHTT